MNRVEELEQAIREALGEFEAWDGDGVALVEIFMKLESALIDDDTLIQLANTSPES